MKPKYPRYTREQNRACKLSDEQIQSIPGLVSDGYSLAHIARMYGVGSGAIKYWLMTPEERKEKHRQNRLKYGNCNKKTKEEKAEIWRETKKRKKELYPEDFKEWKNQTEIQSVHRKTKKWKQKHVKEELRRYHKLPQEKKQKIIRRICELKKIRDELNKV
jgi:hypothetical protein